MTLAKIPGETPGQTAARYLNDPNLHNRDQLNMAADLIVEELETLRRYREDGTARTFAWSISLFTAFFFGFLAQYIWGWLT